MAEVGTAFVSIVPSARGFGSALNAQTGSAAAAAGTSSGKKFGGTFTGATKSMLKGFAGVFAVGAVIKGIRSMVAEGREANKVTALTEQAIKSMGNVAGISAKQVGQLSKSIARKTGIDDEAIQSGSNLLLSFGKVRNEVGKGNQIFNRATQATADLSVRGFGSIDSAAKGLGKALQDPIKGITALGRAGVTFTEGQKKQIKAMVESGNILGAQKIIMREVEKQVGGAAAAASTNADKLRVAFGNMKETFAQKFLIPGIDAVAGVLLKLAPTVKNFFAGLGAGGAGGQLGKTFQSIVTFAKPLLAILMQLGRDALAILKPAFAQISAIFLTQLLPAFRQLLPILAPVAAFLLKIFGGAILGIIKGFVNVVKGALLILTGIFQVFAAIVKGDWTALWNGLKTILSGAWAVIKGIFQIAINVGILGVLKKLPAIVWGLFKLLMRTAWTILKAGWNLISSLFRSALSALGSAVRTGISKVVQFFRELPGKAVGFLKSLPGKLKTAGSDAIAGLRKGLGGAFDKLKTWFTGKIGDLIQAAKDKLKVFSPSKVFMDIGENVAAGMQIGIEKGQPGVGSAVTSLADSAIGAGGAGIGSRFQARNLTNAGAGAAGGAITQNVYPQPRQSEQEVARMSANRILWAMSTS